MTDFQDQPVEESETPDIEDVAEEPVNDNLETDGLQETDESPEEPEGEDTPPEMEFIDIEWEDGQTYQVPAALKDGVLKSKDYTEKTQALAAQRREYEARVEQLQAEEAVAVELIDTRAEINALARQLESASGIDWRQWEQDDFVAAQQGFREYQQMKERMSALQNEYQMKAAERSQMQQAATQERIDQTLEFAKTNLEGWTPEVGKGIEAMMLEQGFTMEQLRASVNPQVYKVMHLAYLGKKALDAAKQRPAKMQKPLQPTRSLSSKGNPPPDRPLHEIDDMEEYAAKRRRQLGMPGG